MYVEGAPDISAEIAKTPKFAIIEEDDCFAPRREVSISYTGANIRKIVKSIPKIITDSLRVTSTNVFLDEYYLDNTDPNAVQFHIFYHGFKNLDKRTKALLEIKIKDGLIKPDGSGSLTLEFKGTLKTTFERRTVLQRTPFYDMFFKMYSYLFYDEMRRQFLTRCKEFSENSMRKTKEILKLMETAVYPHT